jgi:hypothetical protein
VDTRRKGYPVLPSYPFSAVVGLDDLRLAGIEWLAGIER